MNGNGDIRHGFPRPVLLLAAGAVLLRLVLFLGRGDYVAFDEGWYLLLGRSLVTGEGYSLIGIPHVTLSPLFPLLAGPVGALIGDWVWGGRIVAAVASGLLVLPAWAVFRRLAPPRTALIASALVAVLPSLAPFVVPFWIGADLWVGAEPLLHLFLYTGLALWLAADERGGAVRWAAVGAVLGLAFLARPEAVIPWGLVGVVTLVRALLERSPARLARAALIGAGFAVVCAPYWVLLHQATGQWMLTGRSVAPVAAAAGVVGAGRTSAPGRIERMLWGDDRSYERHLYRLDATGLRMGSEYWGIYGAAPPEAAEREQGPTPPEEPLAEGPVQATPDEPPPDGPVRTTPAGGAAQTTPAGERSSTLMLYLRSLGQILPLLLWPFVILGVARPRPPGVVPREIDLMVVLVGTSLAIAFLVAADPRTQLFLVPALAFYAAGGFSLLEREVQQRGRSEALRPGFIELLLVGVAVAWLMTINAQRLYRSLTYGSPHHVVAEQNRQVAGQISSLLPGHDGPLMSWHPAPALFADRDWRPLPFADLPRIIRYAGASGTTVVMLSAYYPPDLKIEQLNIRYLLIPVPEQAVRPQSWRVTLEQADSVRAIGRLEPTR